MIHRFNVCRANYSSPKKPVGRVAKPGTMNPFSFNRRSKAVAKIAHPEIASK
jgi:hypothetical protein